MFTIALLSRAAPRWFVLLAAATDWFVLIWFFGH